MILVHLNNISLPLKISTRREYTGTVVKTCMVHGYMGRWRVLSTHGYGRHAMSNAVEQGHGSKLISTVTQHHCRDKRCSMK